MNGFDFLCVTLTFRYKILAPAAVDAAAGDPKKAAAAVLEASGLDSDQYRLGHTKARIFQFQWTFTAFFIYHSQL